MTDSASGATAGSLIVWAVSGDDIAVAVALEDAPAAGGLTKVLVF